MKKLSIFAGLLAVGLVASPASAQATSAEALASCMLANSGETEKNVLKDMMVKALTDAPTNELQQSTISLGMTMVTLATVNCGMGMNQLEDPIFEQAAEIYGMQMGELVMGEAMARIGG